jgi:hypothetical protein
MKTEAKIINQNKRKLARYFDKKKAGKQRKKEHLRVNANRLGTEFKISILKKLIEGQSEGSV